MRVKAGFTLVEFVVSALLFSIIGAACGSLYYMHGKLITKSLRNVQRVSELQYAVTHMSENISRSAWITLPDSNNIELHSHSSPNIRKYSFADGELSYTEENKPALIITRNLEAKNFFTAMGDMRPQGRYAGVGIEFWEKADMSNAYKDKDLFYAKTSASTKESWNVLCVDPNNSKNIEDGTLTHPFRSLADAVSICEGPEHIVVKSGSHMLPKEGSVDRDVLVKCNYISFWPDTTFIIGEGAKIRMGDNTSIYTEGMFICSGTDAQRTVITSLRDDSWWHGKITINGTQPNLEFINLEISRSNTQPWSRASFHCGAINVLPKAAGLPSNVTISNSVAYDNTIAYYIANAANVEVTNNTFYRNTDYAVVCPVPGLTNAMTVSVHDNDFRGGIPDNIEWLPPAYGQDLYPASAPYIGGGFHLGRQGFHVIRSIGSYNVNLDINNNKFDGFVKAIDISAESIFSRNSSASADVRNNRITNSFLNGIAFSKNRAKKIQIHDNEISLTGLATIFDNEAISALEFTGEYDTGENPLEIKNNIIDGGGKAGGIYVQTPSKSLIISNNEIKNTKFRNSRTAIYAYCSGGDVIIASNLMHNAACGEQYGVSMFSEISPYKSIVKNNIIYNSCQVEMKTLKGDSGSLLINNTFYNTRVYDGILKNCIIWTDNPLVPLNPSAYQIVHDYCVIKGVAASGTNINSNPQFTNEAGENFTLKPGSPCIITGSDPGIRFDNNGDRILDSNGQPVPTERGAYGGDYKPYDPVTKEGGIGPQNKSGIGPQGTVGAAK